MARRKLIWARMAPAITSLTSIGAGVGEQIESQDLLATFRTQAGITRGPVGLTVMRVRMDIEITAVAGGIIDLGQNGFYFGLKVADFQEVVDQEALEEPRSGPQLSPHDDWMAWGRVNTKRAIANSTGTATQVAGWESVDVKSMRKIDELGQTLQLVCQSTAVTAGTVGCLVSTSVLVALP